MTTRAIEVTEEIEQAIARLREAYAGECTCVYREATSEYDFGECIQSCDSPMHGTSLRTKELAALVLAAPIHPVVQGTPIDVAELRAIANACDQTGEALQLVRDERARQNAKWHRKPGQWPDSDGTKLAVLLEEVGEVGRELLESGVIHRGKPPQPNLRAELVQVAAVCVAWIETLPPFTAEEQKVA